MSGVKQYKVEKAFVQSKNGLGEGPYWEESSNTLRWVDIIKKNLHSVDLNKGPSSAKIFADLDIAVGTTADIEGTDTKFAFGGKAGIGIFDKSTGKWEYIKKFWSEEEIKEGKEKRLRSNDGAVDAKGRYWVTTMNDSEEGAEVTDEGVIFRLDPDGTLHRMIEKVSIPNGISWSQDNKLMYFTDSPTKNIFVVDFDLETGNFSNKRVFFHVDEEEAVPDGHCQDAEGHFWVALFGGGKVVRVSPEGKKVAEVILPTRCTTCPGIAGEDLYVTSADDEDEPKKHPESAKLAGSLFKQHIGVKGCKLNRFKWNGNASS